MEEAPHIQPQAIINELRSRRDVPLFYHPDYLDLVCGKGAYSYLGCTDGSGELAAFMPVFIKSKWGIKAWVMPPLTPYGGIFFLPSVYEGKRTAVYTKMKKYTAEILKQAPKPAFTSITTLPAFPDTQVFNWQGWQNRFRYTYRIDHKPGLEDFQLNLSSKTRNGIEKGKADLEVKRSQDLDLFFLLNKATFDRQAVEMVYNQDVVKAIYEGLRNHPFFGVEMLVSYENGEAVAGIMVLRDASTMYYLLSGRKSTAHRGAVSLLIYEAITEAISQGLQFDFEGSNLEGIEPFFRSFGGELTPVCHHLKAGNLFWKVLLTVSGKL